MCLELVEESDHMRALHVKSLLPQCHSCQPILGVNLSPEFVNLHFSYEGRGLLFFCWWQQHFEFQLACVAVEGRSNLVQNTHAYLKSYFQWDFVAYCTRPVSMHLMMACVSCSFDNFSVFLLSLKQQQNLMKMMFSCIHFPIWPYPPKIMKNLYFILVNCMGWQVWIIYSVPVQTSG